MSDRQSSAANRRKRRAPAKAIGSFLPKITAKAFGKYGFAAVALITDWPAIVGAELAAISEPERLKWPRQPSDTAHRPGEEPDNQGATLVLRVDGPLAIEIQHKTPQIIQRINAYFGYRAVHQLRIIQGPIKKKVVPFQAMRPPAATARAETCDITDDRLRAALDRLGAGIAAQRALKSR